MKIKLYCKFITGMLLFACLTSFGNDTRKMNEAIKNMEIAEKKYNERIRRTAVAFMSLETMFPDPKVRELAKAAGKGKIKKIDQLVREGVNVNAQGTSRATPLFWAMRDYDGFKRLLELGADPNIVYDDGNSVMHAAAKLRNKKIIKLALEHGGNPNLVSTDSFRQTPLFEALLNGIDMIDLLLEYGANINARDWFDSTPLLDAAGGNTDFEIVYHLLERGADYSLKDRNGYDLALKLSRTVGRLRPGTKGERWQKKVIDWLHAKGVEIPPDPLRHKRIIGGSRQP
jgi:hypothetical protein